MEDNTDTVFMKRCLQLAIKGAASVETNPMVGAVIVYENKIIGEGYHEFFGGPHAEINAINSVKDKSLFSESTLYVSLEPCCHYGKTPPCTNAIVEHKFKRVVVGCRDFSEKVNGKGIEILKENNIEVTENILLNECIELNRKFFTANKLKRPFITLKWAQSADGFIGKENEGQVKISNDASSVFVHQLRAENNAIAIGKNTLMSDNPLLNVRLWKGKNPLRILFSNNAELPKALNFFRDQNFIVFHSDKTKINTSNYVFLNSENKLYEAMEYLFKIGIHSVLAEGGALLHQSFIDSYLYDEVVIIKSKINLYNGIAAPKIEATLKNEFYLGTDKVEIYKM